MPTELITARRTTLARLFGLVPVLTLVAGGLWILYLAYARQSWLGLFIGIVAIVAGMVYLLASPSYRLTVTDAYVEQVEWRTKQIYYHEVREVEMVFGELTISAPGKKMKIDSAITDYESVLRAIASRLSPVGGVIYRGDPNDIRRYFGKTATPEKDTLIP